MTYSIIIKEGEIIGIGVVSGSIAVGSRVPWAIYKRGGVVTQGHTNTNLGPIVLELLKEHTASEALEMALSKDPGKELRQVAVLDRFGNAAAFTGERTWNAKKHIALKNKVCLGNLLISEKVVDALCEFSEFHGEIQERIIQALQEAHEVGGDSRGDRSAAILIVGRNEPDDKLLDIRVDYSRDPIKKLIEIYEMLSSP